MMFPSEIYIFVYSDENMFVVNKVVKYCCLLDTLFNYCYEKRTMSRLITSNFAYNFLEVEAKCMLQKRICCNQHNMKGQYKDMKVNRV